MEQPAFILDSDSRTVSSSCFPTSRLLFYRGANFLHLDASWNQESTLFKWCSGSDDFLARINRTSILAAALSGRFPPSLVSVHPVCTEHSIMGHLLLLAPRMQQKARKAGLKHEERVSFKEV